MTRRRRAPAPVPDADPLPDVDPGPDAGVASAAGSFLPAGIADGDEPGDEPGDVDGGRPVSLQLARVHLRMGALALARAELESFAGIGTLDDVALLDLAEARWRTGDLAGAGEAATTAIGRGVDEPLAFVIAAEAMAGLGRPAEARRLAGRALARNTGSLEGVFAGMPRSTVWPPDPGPDAVGLAVAGTASAGRAPAGSKRPARGGNGDDPASASASAAAAGAFAGGRAALGGGSVATAALGLGVAIRLEPAFAQGVLDAIGDRMSDPALALVAGDALRLLGREHEALAAYDVARGRVPDPASAEPAEREEPDPDAGPA